MYLKKYALVYMEVEFPPGNLLNDKLFHCYRSMVISTRHM